MVEPEGEKYFFNFLTTFMQQIGLKNLQNKKISRKYQKGEVYYINFTLHRTKAEGQKQQLRDVLKIFYKFAGKHQW